MNSAQNTCPHCGGPLPQQEPSTSTSVAAQTAPEDREYDHRGIPMLQHTRVGGIIVPQ